jgi:hypothetical protein
MAMYLSIVNTDNVIMDAPTGGNASRSDVKAATQFETTLTWLARKVSNKGMAKTPTAKSIKD